MQTVDLFKNYLKRDLCVQGFNGTPLFVSSAAISGLVMKEALGYGYECFIIGYKNEYGELHYLNDDFKRIWKIIKKELEKNPEYLRKLKKQYEENWSGYEEFFSRTDLSKLNGISEGSLLDLLQKYSRAQAYSVGPAHIIEAIGIEIEKELKKELEKCGLDEKEFNRYYVVLTAPSRLSFLAQEEKELLEVAEGPAESRDEKIKKHSEKYFWIENSYAKPVYLTPESFLKKMGFLKRKQVKREVNFTKEELIRKLGLSKAAEEMISIIDFSTVWQDERKANILKIVGYLDIIIEEIGRRFDLEKRALYYLSYNEVLALKSLRELKGLEAGLKQRRSGVFFLNKEADEFVCVGEQYDELVYFRKKSAREGELENSMELRGSIANGGSAIGRVIVCKDLASLNKVKEGDILVASMTRPEFMVAIKKAAGIVTDEGGITCHAAIIARELDIPAVIGTKVATKVLKDGMTVEVKANHGIVRILKK